MMIIISVQHHFQQQKGCQFYCWRKPDIVHRENHGTISQNVVLYRGWREASALTLVVKGTDRICRSVPNHYIQGTDYIGQVDLYLKPLYTLTSTDDPPIRHHPHTPKFFFFTKTIELIEINIMYVKDHWSLNGLLQTFFFWI